MSNTFIYSTLYYTPSIFTDEAIAIGVLYIFPNTGFATFQYPTKLNRLKVFYPAVDEKLLLQYLKQIDSKVKKNIDKKFASFVFDNNYKALIDSCVLNEDESALKFSAIQGGVFYSTPEKIIEQYNGSIFGAFNTIIKKKEQKLDEKAIVQKIKTIIKSIDDTKLDLVSFDEQKLIIQNNHIQFKADLFWKNCSERYTKAVSLDLEEEHIINKSLLIASQLRKVSNIINREHSQVDLLINTSPKQGFKTVTNQSIDILRNDSEVNVNLVYNFEDYGREIAENAKPF